MVVVLKGEVARLSSQSVATQISAASVLKKLALVEANRGAIAAAGGVEALVALLVSNNAEVQDEAAAALRCLAIGSNDIRQRIVASGSLSHLQVMLQSANVEVQEQAAGVLKTLALHPELVSQIVAAHVVPSLVALCNSVCKGVQQDAAGALRNIAADSGAAMEVVQSNGVPPLVRLLRSASQDVQETAVGALLSLARGADSAGRKTIVEAGSLTALRGVVQAGNRPRTLAAAHTALELLGAVDPAPMMVPPC